jgi:AAA15 family ATPase/GTPase
MIKHPSINVIVGQPESGKSNLIKYLVYEFLINHPIDLVFVFTKTDYDDDYDYIDNRRIYTSFNIESIKKIIKFLENYKRKYDKHVDTILIFDDCIDDQSKTQLFRDLVYNHRHLSITIFYAVQYLAGNLPKKFRSCVSNAYIFKDPGDALDNNHNSFLRFMNHKDYMDLNFKLPLYSFIHVDTKGSKYEVCKVENVVDDFHIIYKKLV